MWSLHGANHSLPAMHLQPFPTWYVFDAGAPTPVCAGLRNVTAAYGRMGGPRSLWNGNYVSTAEHALSDPNRYWFMPKSWKAENRLPNMAWQQWVRIPNVYKGAAAGGAAGAAGAGLSSDCTCPQ